MKASTILLAGSVALNAVFAGIVLIGISEHEKAGSESATKQAATANTTTTNVTAPAEDWAKLPSDDLPTLAEKLRQNGFPPILVRAIISAQARERYATQRDALERSVENVPYWRNPSNDPKVSAQMRELESAARREMREALGPDYNLEVIADLQRQLPNVTADKLEQIAAIRDRYSEKRRALFETSSGMNLTPEDREKRAGLEKDMHAEFASVLSPAELEEFDLRTGNLANNLRYELAAFDVTEFEFRTLYKLQSAFEDQFPSYQRRPGVDQQRADAQKKMREEIAAAFGPERYAQYERATSYDYRQTTDLLTRLELPKTAADELYALSRDFQKRRNELNASGSLEPDRRQALAALQEEALQKVSAVFQGNSRYVDAYKLYGGNWLKSLEPPVVRPAPKS